MKDSDDALVGVLLDDTEIGHTCLKCTSGFSPKDLKPFELPGEPRLLQCEKCKVARYCNAEVSRIVIRRKRSTYQTPSVPRGRREGALARLQFMAHSSS